MAIWDTFTNEKQWRDYLSRLLKRNDEALDKAIVLIYNSQTLEEQVAQQSSEDNNVGFTKWDAEFLSGLAKDIISGKGLSEGERAVARNKMPKYWKQLMVISKKQQSTKVKQKQSIKREQAREQFRYNIGLMQRCSERGEPCEYGICDECPVTQGLQMRMVL